MKKRKKIPRQAKAGNHKFPNISATCLQCRFKNWLFRFKKRSTNLRNKKPGKYKGCNITTTYTANFLLTCFRLSKSCITFFILKQLLQLSCIWRCYFAKWSSIRLEKQIHWKHKHFQISWKPLKLYLKRGKRSNHFVQLCILSLYCILSLCKKDI